MLGLTWHIVYDAGPTSAQHWPKCLVFAGKLRSHKYVHEYDYVYKHDTGILQRSNYELRHMYIIIYY